MNILEQIVAKKQIEVANKKSLYPILLLEKSIFMPSPVVSMKKYLRRDDKSGIIAEFKRKSPSKGVINSYSTVEKTSIGYMQAGASGLSILTDEEFFGGKNEDLLEARKFNFCPILRKDFTIDEYQIVEAKSIGADCILLIAAILTPEKTVSLAQFAKKLGLEVLLEVHDADEAVNFVCDEIDIVGVNNRDLKTFETSIELSKELADKIPSKFLKISESGLSNPADVVSLKTYGYEGFLMGEHFMRQSRPELACKQFIDKLNQIN
jgi:indole-3-glycerol phosphate synthase